MGPEEFSRLMAFNSVSGGFAAAFSRDPNLQPAQLPTGEGSLNGDLGLCASARGDNTVHPIRDNNVEHDCLAAETEDLDYAETAPEPPPPVNTSNRHLSLFRDISPLRRRIPKSPAHGIGLTRSKAVLGPRSSKSPRGRSKSPRRSRSPRVARRSRSPRVARRSRSPRVARRSRSPRVARRSRSPRVARRSRSPRVARRSRSPRRSRSSSVARRSKSPLASDSRSPSGAPRVPSPQPSVSKRLSPTPSAAPRCRRGWSPESRTRFDNFRSRGPGGLKPAIGLQKWNQLRRSYCIKLCNVPPSITYSEIWSRFRPFVTYVEMDRDDGSALVYQDRLEAREKALASSETILEKGMTMMPWEGGSDILPPEPIDTSHPKASRTLFVSHLDKSVSRRDLRTAFQRFGRILDVEIKRIPRAKHYYAVLQFSTVESVCLAIKQLDGSDLGGSKVHLSFGVTPESKCIFASGLSSELTSNYIMQRFMRFGQVEKVVYNPQSCTALILFKTIAHATQAVEHVKTNQRDSITLDYADDHYQLLFCQTMKMMGFDSGDFLFM